MVAVVAVVGVVVDDGTVVGAAVVGAAVVGGVVTTGGAVVVGAVVATGASVMTTSGAGAVVAGALARATGAVVGGAAARRVEATATMLVVVLVVVLGTVASVGAAGVPAARRSPTTTVDRGWSTVRWGVAAPEAGLARFESRDVAIMISPATTTPTARASSALWRNG